MCVCVCVEGGGGGGRGVTDFKFGTFIGRFQSDGASSMAVKGLNWYFPSWSQTFPFTRKEQAK